jgi:hypothetical protein
MRRSLFGAGSATQRRAVWATVLVVLTGVVLWGWLRASPPGSSPDDDYHLASIWCADGFVDGRCLPSVTQGAALGLVPEKLVETTCYRRRTNVSAACLETVLSGRDDILVAVTTNLDIGRADLYYRVANRIITDDIPASIARIRAMNAAIVLIMVLLSALVATPSIRVAVIVSWLVASVPLGLFLATSVNTTAWGLAGLGTFWANALSAIAPQQRYRRIAASILAAIGAMMALGSRTEALPHLLIIATAVAALWALDREPGTARRLGQRLRTFRGAVLALATMAGILVVGSVLAPTALLLAPLSQLRLGWSQLVARGIGNPAASLTLEVPQFWTGVLGSWNLGWLDTPPPATTWVLTTAVFAGLLTLGLQGAHRGRMAAVAIVVSGLFVFPTISLISAGVVVQEEFQARHFMSLVYVLLGLAMLRDRGQPRLAIGRAAQASLAGALSVAHAAALHLNISRYTNGLVELRYSSARAEVEWWWSSGPSPGATWAITSIAFALAAFGALSVLREAPTDR